MTDTKRDAAKKSALQKFDTDTTKTNSFTGWPERIERGFLQGFDAGYDAARQWNDIASEADLPTKDGQYLWEIRSNGKHRVQHFTRKFGSYFVSKFVAWQEITPRESGK